MMGVMVKNKKEFVGFVTSRHKAYEFLLIFHHYSHHLFTASIATYQLFALHTNPDTQPKVEPKSQVDWDELLEPYTFRETFPFEKPNRLLSQVSPNPEFP